MSDYVYPEIVVEANFNGDGSTWTAVTDVVQGSISGRWGIPGSGVLERVAPTDWFGLALRNDAGNSGGLAGYYTPGHANVRAGWGVGLRVRLGFGYDGFTKYFHGRIPAGGIQVDPNTYGKQQVQVRVHGWMEQLAIHELDLLAYVTDVTLDEVAGLIVTNMDIAPLATEYATGRKTFPAGFDTLRAGDTAMQELAKAVFSEWGYAYVKRDLVSGETFVVESALTRSEKREPDDLPLATSASGFLLKEDGGYLLKEDGDRIVLNQAETASFVGDMTLESPESSHAEDLINYAQATVYPREVQTNVTLFTLQKRILLAPGETVDGIRGRYRDPTGGNAAVSGKNMATVSDMNSLESGGGTDLSAFLTVTPSYGTDEVAWTIQNTHISQAGWVYLEAKGDAVFIYDAVDRVEFDQASIDAHGRREAQIPLKYHDDPLQGQAFAEYVVQKNATPRMRFLSAQLLANYSAKHMMAFLFLDVSSRVYLEQALSGMANDFYIQGVEFEVKPGPLLYYRWFLREADDDEYWELGVSALDESTALGFA